MADVTPLPISPAPKAGEAPTRNALRQRRHRAKRKASLARNATVTPAVIHPTPVPTEGRGGRGVTLATAVAALSLAAVSAGFSITGMTAVFVGATVPVIGMGVALELGKLSAVAWLGRYGGAPALRGALIVLVAVLMGLNAVGCYGLPGAGAHRPCGRRRRCGCRPRCRNRGPDLGSGREGRRSYQANRRPQRSPDHRCARYRQPANGSGHQRAGVGTRGGRQASRRGG